MLPLILLAAGAYIIGEAVFEDDKYAEGGMMAKGGMMKGRKPDYESKKGEELTKKAIDEEQRMSFLYYQTGFRTTDGRYDDDIKKQAKNNWDDLAVRIQMIVEESIYFSDMANGGMITSISEAKKVIGNVQKSKNEDFSWFVTDLDYEGEEDYDQEYGVHLTDSDLIQLANELKGEGYMAKGGGVVSNYRLTFMNDDGEKKYMTTVAHNKAEAMKEGKWWEKYPDYHIAKGNYKVVSVVEVEDEEDAQDPSYYKIRNQRRRGIRKGDVSYNNDYSSYPTVFNPLGNARMAKGGDVEGEILKEAFFQGGKNGSKAAIGKDFETYEDWIKKNKIKSHKLYEKAFQDGGKSAFNNMKGRDFQTFEEWEKENIDKMAKGGKTQGYDDREDERLAMQRGKIAKKDLKSTHARRDDARFEERGK
jgi:hypothetical protein